MDNGPRQVGCNGSGLPIISTSNEDEYLPAERKGEVKHDLENPSPSLGSGVTEVSQGPAADVNCPAATSLQPTFEHTGTVMQQCADWQHYVVTAISNIERRLASMDQGINGRLNAMNGRLAALEVTVLRQPKTTAAMTTSRIVACPVSSPTSSLGDSENSEIRVAHNKYLKQTGGGVSHREIRLERRKAWESIPPNQTSQRRSRRLCAQQDSSGSSGNDCATSLSIPPKASLPTSPLEANTSGMQHCKVEEPTGEEPANHLEGDRNLPLREYSCVLCGKAYAKIKRLNEHVNRMHKQRRRFSCELCSKTFAYRATLKEHIDNVHKNLRKFPCNICGNSFKRSGALKSHLETVHQDKRKFPCDICGNSFKRREALKTHVNTVHERLREFLCAICGRSFTRSESVKKHLARLHPDAPENPS